MTPTTTLMPTKASTISMLMLKDTPHSCQMTPRSSTLHSRKKTAPPPHSLAGKAVEQPRHKLRQKQRETIRQTGFFRPNFRKTKGKVRARAKATASQAARARARTKARASMPKTRVRKDRARAKAKTRAKARARKQKATKELRVARKAKANNGGEEA